MATYGVSVYNGATYDAGQVGANYGTGSYGGIDGTYGSLSTSAAPPTPGPFTPPEVATPGRFFQPPIAWRFILANTSDLSHIGEIFSKQVTVTLALNRSGSLSFNVPLDAPGVEFIRPITTCVKAYRKGELIWSGPVLTTEDDPTQNSLSVTCTGWFEILNHRFLRHERIYSNNDWTAGEIAHNLLNMANTQRDGPITQFFPEGNGLVRPTWVAVGSNFDTQVRNRTYSAWQNIGQAITEWSEVENGYDFEVTHDTRVLNIYSNTLGSQLRRDRPEVQFGYNWGPNNLRSFRIQTDASTLVTQAHAVGTLNQGASASAGGTSPSPLDVYGLWEEQHNLSDVGDPNVLLAFVTGEVALKSTPKIVYSMAPFPYTAEHKRVPEPFVDYKVGDHVYFTAKYAKRITISRQAIRIYGMTVTVDENNNENISDLQVSPNV